MSRYFDIISLDDFKKITKRYIDNPSSIMSDFLGDFSKIKFDIENISCTDNYGWAGQSLLGYQTIDNGIELLGFNCGGDWERAIYLCLYFSGKKLRGYIPTEGNTWNKLTKTALGNNATKDTVFLSKLFPKEYAEAKNNPDKDEYWENAFSDTYMDMVFLNRDLLIKDIKSRILLNPKKIHKSTDDTIMGNIHKIVENTTYYTISSCGDEVSELWREMCILCYQLDNLNQEDRARIVLKWIVEDAEMSKEFVINQLGSIDKAHLTNGIWGF